jgi:hypothetical protein
MIERTLDAQWMVQTVKAMEADFAHEETLRTQALDMRNWFVRGSENGVEGLFWFRPLSQKGVWEVHAAVAKEFHGWKWVALSRKVARWFFAATGAKELRTFCPAANRESELYARLCGMRRMGAGKLVGETGTHMVLRRSQAE